MRGPGDVLYTAYERQLVKGLPPERLPRHVGLMLDGNRRWAKKRGANTAHGHKAGADNIEPLLTWCEELGIEVVTLWLLSTDNLKRSETELAPLLAIIEDVVDELSAAGNRRFNLVGALGLLPEATRTRLENAVSATQDGDGMVVNIAVGYGGRQEIVDAFRAILLDAAERGEDMTQLAQRLTIDSVGDYLYTKGQPDPDLVIRTSGEQRLGGFLLWFEAYGQSIDPEFHWPVFGDTFAWHLWDELLGIATVVGIIVLIVIRQLNHPRVPERLSRFGGSRFGPAYFVEVIVLLEGLGMILVKASKIATYGHANAYSDFFTMQVAKLLPASPTMVSVFALIKLMSGMIWLAVIGRNITVLGAAFKPNSDDVRDSPALAVAGQLSLAGASVRVYDPQAMGNARKVFPTLDYAASLDDALTGAELVILATEWQEFKEMDPVWAAKLVGGRVLINGRNVLPVAEWQNAGWQLRALGRSLGDN